MPDPKNTTFKPIGTTRQKMHGATAVLVSGLSAQQQQQLRQLMDNAGLQTVPAVYINAESLSLTLADAAKLPAESHAGETAELPVAMIMSGMLDCDLHTLMKAYRESDLPRPLWASVTPTSEKWTIKALLIELLKEREALREATNRQAPPSNQPR